MDTRIVKEGIDTRTRVLDSAERLMAERGIGGVSLRAILVDAGASSAALHYYFGSREGVVRGVWERRGVAQFVREREMLEALESESGIGSATVLDVVHVVVDPLVETLFDGGESGRRYVRFLARLESERSSVVENAGTLHSADVEERLGRILVTVCRELPESGLRRRLRLVLDSVVGMLASSDVLAVEWTGDEDIEALLEFVVTLKRFLVGGLLGSK